MTDLEILQGLNAWKTKVSVPSLFLYIVSCETKAQNFTIGVFTKFEKAKLALLTLDFGAYPNVTEYQVQEKVQNKIHVVYLYTNYSGVSSEIVEFMSTSLHQVENFASKYKNTHDAVFNPTLCVKTYQLDKIYKQEDDQVPESVILKKF